MGSFIARAVVDELLPPAFLSQVTAELQQAPQQKEAIAKARRLLEGTHVGERLANIWSNNVSHSAKKLKRSMRYVYSYAHALVHLEQQRPSLRLSVVAING